MEDEEEEGLGDPVGTVQEEAGVSGRRSLEEELGVGGNWESVLEPPNHDV